MYREAIGICYYLPSGSHLSYSDAPSWRKKTEGTVEERRQAEIIFINAEIKRLNGEKEAIENNIKAAWERMDKICGHPKVQVVSWSKSECIDCGRYDRTNYFWDLGSTIVDVDGSEKRK